MHKDFVFKCIIKEKLTKAKDSRDLIEIAHLRNINHFAYDTNLVNHQDSEFTLTRLLEYSNILRRRFDINVRDGALG